jgi:alanyl-tRNA synthetase
MEECVLVPETNVYDACMQDAQPLETTVMELNAAKAAGAVAMFGEKYENDVRVVNVPGVSMELCGGTHVGNTVEIGGFKITSETGIASGIRRIEAVSGPSLLPYLDEVDAVARVLSSKLKVAVDAIPERVEALQRDLVAKEKQIIALQSELALARAAACLSEVCNDYNCEASQPPYQGMLRAARLRMEWHSQTHDER